MSLKHLSLKLYLSIALSCSTSSAMSALVDYNEISASTSMIPGAFPINQIVDGITSDAPPFNGFTSPQTSGVITLDFLSTQNLGSFILHNDINVLAEGIRDFRLDFYDALGNQILTPFSTSYTGPQGQLAGEEYIFNQAITGVSSVDLVIFNTNLGGASTQVEIREVQFSVSTVPIPAAVWLFGSGIIGLVGLARRK